MTTRPGTSALAQRIHRKLATSAPTPARLAEAHRRSQTLVARCGLPVPADLPPRCHLAALNDSELRDAAWAVADRLRAQGIVRGTDWAGLSMCIHAGDRKTWIDVVLMEVCG